MDEQLLTAKAEFIIWKRRTNKGIPALAMRVFALRKSDGRPHSRMEMLLGRVMAELNDHERLGKERYTFDTITTDSIILELMVEELYTEVKKIETHKGV